MRDIIDDLKELDRIVGMIRLDRIAGMFRKDLDAAYYALVQFRDTVATDAGYDVCDGCGEWVALDAFEAELCPACCANLSQAEEDARADAADAAREAEKINRHLWSLGGRRLPLILIAAWSVVVAACGGVPCK